MFSRLTKPSLFTGIQKAKALEGVFSSSKKTITKNIKSKTNKDIVTYTFTPGGVATMSSSTVTTTSTPVMASSNSNKVDRSGSSEKTSLFKLINDGRPVWDRLTDRSNFTGTRYGIVPIIC